MSTDTLVDRSRAKITALRNAMKQNRKSIGKALLYAGLVAWLAATVAFHPVVADSPSHGLEDTPTYQVFLPEVCKNTATPIPPTATPRPTATPKPSPTPYPRANFIHPINPILQYNCVDLLRGPGIKSDCGDEFNFPVPHICTEDGIPVMGTNDDHKAWDFGASNSSHPYCPKDVAGMEVNGMSVGYNGEVIRIKDDGDQYIIWVDYGPLQLTNGEVKQIVIKYGHSTTMVSLGDIVNAEVVVAKLNEAHEELEMAVFAYPLDIPKGDITYDESYFISPTLLGLQPKTN